MCLLNDVCFLDNTCKQLLKYVKRYFHFHKDLLMKVAKLITEGLQTKQYTSCISHRTPAH